MCFEMNERKLCFAKYSSTFSEPQSGPLNQRILETSLIDADKDKKFHAKTEPLPIHMSSSDRHRDINSEENQLKEIYNRSTWQIYNRIIMYRRKHDNLYANIQLTLVHPETSKMISTCKVNSSINDDEEDSIFCFEM